MQFSQRECASKRNIKPKLVSADLLALTLIDKRLKSMRNYRIIIMCKKHHDFFRFRRPQTSLDKHKITWLVPVGFELFWRVPVGFDLYWRGPSARTCGRSSLTGEGEPAVFPLTGTSAVSHLQTVIPPTIPRSS